ncbi:glycosyltransferase [Curtobacterium sp. GD1]|uniref:glycosyltransferase n=1 Tax=Curtobacterium sp. GD1 TaxID=2810612 RepID=UPI001E5031AF|nr:glycosyltransferase [Curtobacterium sp. GD1]
MTALVPTDAPTAAPRHRGADTDWRPVHRCSVRRHVDEGWVASARVRDGVLVLTSGRSDPDVLRAALTEEFGEPVVLRTVDESVVRQRIMWELDDELADIAAHDLARTNPAMSARTVLSRGQQVGGAAALLVFVLCLVLAPGTTAAIATAVLSLGFLAGIVFKFWVSMVGARFDLVEQVSTADIEALDESTLPTYTVLVPVFREANIVHDLVRNLEVLDWPKDRLEVLVLVEAEDHETRQAVLDASPPPWMRVVIVPPGSPQTKPRACNVGLAIARGEYVVIYDAEDRPDPDQLKKVFVSFGRAGADTVCVQAALSYFNADENALTRMFTLEYSYWFDYMLAGLDARNLPIPLGGTSNHFRTELLRELGGWDPYNVTEDADLGIRASAVGYRVSVVNSTTMEEANTSIPNFVRQRSRWIKGYMQTALVHARRPRALVREIGLRRAAAFTLLIAGTPLTFLGMLPGIVVTIATFVLPSSWTAPVFPTPVLWLCVLDFLLGNATMIYLTMMGPYKRARFDLMGWALLNPFYWVLHSIAAYKGLWQLITRPHYWEKTEHGLTKTT